MKIKVGSVLVENYIVGEYYLDEVLYGVGIIKNGEEFNLVNYEDNFKNGRDLFIKELMDLDLINGKNLIIKEGSILLEKNEYEDIEGYKFNINNVEVIFNIYIEDLENNYFKFK